jgi:hypothetical protein
MRNIEYCQDCACEPEGVCRHCFEQLEKENAELRENWQELKERIAEHISVFTGKRGGKNYCAGLHVVLNFMKEQGE